MCVFFSVVKNLFKFVTRRFPTSQKRPMIPYGLRTCLVIDVYDGDTITVVFFYRGYFYTEKCRLQGINTPEIRTKDSDEKQKGVKARDELSKLIKDVYVNIDFTKREKYGRLLGHVYLNNGLDVNKHMVSSGHAIPYMV